MHIDKGQRITGKARVALRRDLAARYATGASIRSLVELSGRSYGSVHGLLCEAGVELRGRGGSRQTRRS